MNYWMSLRRKIVTLVVLVAFLTCSVGPASAVSPIKIKNWTGTIDFTTGGPTPFHLAGTASHLGQFTDGEMEFLPVPEDESLVGVGVAVLTAANGDQLVGVVTWDVDPEVDG